MLGALLLRANFCLVVTAVAVEIDQHRCSSFEPFPAAFHRGAINIQDRYTQNQTALYLATGRMLRSHPTSHQRWR